MTEADARHLLWRWPDDDGLEGWIAEQPWEATPSGWTVTGELQGWQFRIEAVPGGLQIRADQLGTPPAVWVITG
ncbi:hypothetical protein ACFQS7_30050 [Dankookia sp. GCM10030260]|uniref:hypothetical protein n=1 Tax=Dankookia sp. GCM10030260 TaxID=3273390 RepID=UPI0036175A08